MARSYQLKGPVRSTTTEPTDFASLLNEQQLAAVTSPPGASLVIAGAGSGKTRTLTYRVAYLLENGFSPQDILLLTFTNKAAKEMLQRVADLVPQDVMAIWGGTFHSIGNRILRKFGDHLGYTRGFTILDRDDQNSLLTISKKATKLKPQDKQASKRFPKASILADIYSMAQNLDRPLEDVLDERYPQLEDFFEDIIKIQGTYEKRKLETNAVDFDDLLCKTLKLLEEHKEVREGYQQKFRAILVDEYQDTNPVQSRMIDLLAGKHKHLMVVGDDAQSIYSWRGADFRNIMGFSKRYPEAVVHKIETNYRSVPEVLELANESISANVNQFEKELQPARKSAECKPALIQLADPNQQAAFVAQRIQELAEEEEVPFSEIAVLYRAHFQSMELQMELTQRRLPFKLTSGPRFFEQAHVKDVSAFMRFVYNPRDEVAFKRMLKLVDGIGDVTADKLWKAWLSCEASKMSTPPESYSDLLLGFQVGKKSEAGWQQLAYTLDELVEDGEPVEPSKMIHSVVEAVYDDYMKTQFTNYDRRRQDLDQVMRYSEQYTDLETFLTQLSLETNLDEKPQAQRSDGEDEITLTSIHQAKGLEWQVVFVIWLTDGMFPNRRAIESGDYSMDAYEEERRLFYVAVTRACDQLYLTHPMVGSGRGGYQNDYYQTPSSFLTELPQDLMEEWDVGSTW